MELRVKEVCKRKGMTLNELAEALQISRQALSKSITNNPTIDRIQQIADILGVSIFELISADDKTYHSYTENNEWKGVFLK